MLLRFYFRRTANQSTTEQFELMSFFSQKILAHAPSLRIRTVAQQNLLGKRLTMKFYLIVAAVATTSVASFTVAPQVRLSSTALNLVPEQGCQLKAAWEAAATHLQDEPHHPHVTPAAAARNFAARVFSLPSTFLHPHPQEAVGDVVYYPVVGFHYTLQSTKPLPTTAFPTASSCRIPSPSEALYGWFSPACLLSHPDSDDYLQEPKKE